MLAWVVIYRRHLQHSTAIPSSLRLCVKLSAPHRSNLPLCSPFPSTSLPPHFLTSRSSCPPALAPSGSTHHCFKSFSCNTYRSPRKCGKQKTYVPAKFFRCTLTKNRGWGQSEALFRLTVQLSAVDCQPPPPRFSTDHRTRITTDDSPLVVSCG